MPTAQKEYFMQHLLLNLVFTVAKTLWKSLLRKERRMRPGTYRLIIMSPSKKGFNEVETGEPSNTFTIKEEEKSYLLTFSVWDQMLKEKI